MKKIIYLVLIMLALTMFDNTIATFFAIYNIYPNILLIFIVFFSIINGNSDAIFVGIISGILQDTFYPGPFGVNILVNFLICIVAAQVGRTIFKEKRIIPIISVFLLTILRGVLIYGIMFVFKQKGMSIAYIPYKAIYNMVISIFMYRLVYKLSQSKIMKREWRF